MMKNTTSQKIKRRREIISGGLSGTAVLLAGCITGDGDEESESTDDGDGDEESESTDDGDGDEESESTEENLDEIIFREGNEYEFSGQGNDVSEEFALERGLIAVDFEISGDISWVELVPIDADGFGAGSDNILRDWSSRQGRTGKLVTGGTYRLDVDIESEWIFEVSQPKITEDDILELPINESGTGTALIGPFRADGTVVEAIHRGSELFTLQTFPIDGGFTVQFRDNDFEGTTVIEDEGITWAQIMTKGDWEVTID